MSGLSLSSRVRELGAPPGLMPEVANGAAADDAAGVAESSLTQLHTLCEGLRASLDKSIALKKTEAKGTKPYFDWEIELLACPPDEEKKVPLDAPLASWH